MSEQKISQEQATRFINSRITVDRPKLLSNVPVRVSPIQQLPENDPAAEVFPLGYRILNSNIISLAQEAAIMDLYDAGEYDKASNLALSIRVKPDLFPQGESFAEILLGNVTNTKGETIFVIKKAVKAVGEELSAKVGGGLLARRAAREEAAKAALEKAAETGTPETAPVIKGEKKEEKAVTA